MEFDNQPLIIEEIFQGNYEDLKQKQENLKRRREELQLEEDRIQAEKQMLEMEEVEVKLKIMKLQEDQFVYESDNNLLDHYFTSYHSNQLETMNNNINQ